MYFSRYELSGDGERISRPRFVPVFALYTLAAVIVPLLMELDWWNYLMLHLAANYLLKDLVVKRLHDMGRSGSGYVICFLPCVGYLYWIYVAAKRGLPEASRNGGAPLQSGGSDTDA